MTLTEKSGHLAWCVLVTLFNCCGWYAEPESDASLPHPYSLNLVLRSIGHLPAR